MLKGRLDLPDMPELPVRLDLLDLLDPVDPVGLAAVRETLEPVLARREILR